MNQFVRVGVGVIVINQEGKVLIGKRKGSHGSGTYSFPGGHQEFGEKIEETAVRELKEETNLDANISHIKLGYFTDDYMQEDMKHYVTFLPILRIFQGELMNMEPHKLEQWEWMDWNDIKYLGEKLFLPIQNFIKKYPDFHPKNI